ncbi:MAG: thiamine pyrophosphate-dependent dehydrogenase E1 component subunit alpha [Candidatus Omnitrophota bacterium]
MNKAQLTALYETMLKIRLVELKIEELYPQDEMRTPVHLCIGQEAAPAGVCANLEKDDYVFSNHRGHGHYIAMGGDLRSMIAELYCKETGCSKGRGGSMHLIDTAAGFIGSSSIVAGSIPIATGAALASVLRNRRGRVSVVFFGDAASEEGVLFESMNFAALKRLPVVYVCENNFYSVFSHQSARQANCDIFKRPRAFDIPSYLADGTDAADVYLKSRKAVCDARSGRGPSFLECRAYRWRGHAGPGDPLKDSYRKPGEWDEWIVKDPVKKFEGVLKKKKVITGKSIEKLRAKIEREIMEAFEFAIRSPLPARSAVAEYLVG